MEYPLDNELVRKATMLFISVNRCHRKVFDQFVLGLQISNSQHRLLMHLYHTECSQSQTELARTFEVSTAAIAVSLKKLEKSGYIRRCSAVTDNRYNEIALTEEGLALVHETNRMFTSADVAMFSELNQEELASFVGCLEKMKNTLKSIRAGERDLPKVEGIHVREIIAAGTKD